MTARSDARVARGFSSGIGLSTVNAVFLKFRVWVKMRNLLSPLAVGVAF
jgi:hypothetical protein